MNVQQQHRTSKLGERNDDPPISKGVPGKRNTKRGRRRAHVLNVMRATGPSPGDTIARHSLAKGLKNSKKAKLPDLGTLLSMVLKMCREGEGGRGIVIRPLEDGQVAVSIAEFGKPSHALPADSVRAGLAIIVLSEGYGIEVYDGGKKVKKERTTNGKKEDIAVADAADRLAFVGG